MVPQIYKRITEPTREEIQAARAYRTESGFFQLACQSNHCMALDALEPFQRFLRSNKLLLLRSATSLRYQLTRNATLYSGHGNRVGTVGALGANEVECFRNMTWKYSGFTSTSSQREVAETFALARRTQPVLLEFHLAPGFRLFPMDETGEGHEQEYLLPPSVPCVILEASNKRIREVDNVLHLILQPAN
jgi:hypothetical protein